MKAAERAYNVLRTAIIEGRHPPGARITEAEVAEAAGVSRTPVREALRRLDAEGLLRFVPNQGAFVSSWSEADAEDIFELRAMLEGYGAALAARKASEAQTRTLRELATRQHEEACRGAPGCLERIADLNGRFHQLLLEAADSERLHASLNTLTSAPLVLETFRDYSSEDLRRSARHHLEMVEAIEAGDSSWAQSVMHSHVAAARRAFRRRHEDPGSGDAGANAQSVGR